MSNPFPGMNPYLEQHWRSVHHRLITYAGDRLQATLPSHLRVEIEERVFAIQAAAEPLREAYLEIVDTASGNRVITAVEFLSPTNKTACDGYELYAKKQREYLAGDVSVVEIDLTRGGDRDLVLLLSLIPRQHRATYLACVRRSWQPLSIEAYPLALDKQLPVIGIPLRQEESDAPLDLQWLVNECYEKGRYDDIDYTCDPDPPLANADAAWASEILRAKGLRS